MKINGNGTNCNRRLKLGEKLPMITKEKVIILIEAISYIYELKTCDKAVNELIYDRR